jgi:Flp pilus assembly secretin CpaC
MSVPRNSMMTVLLLLLFGAMRSTATGEDVKVAAGPRIPVTVSIHATVPLQLSSKQRIESVRVEKEGVVRIGALAPDTLLVYGLGYGITKIYLTAAGGKHTEVVEVIVEQDMEFLKMLLRRVTPTASVTPLSGGGNTIILTGTVLRAEDIPIILKIAAGGK